MTTSGQTQGPWYRRVPRWAWVALGAAVVLAGVVAVVARRTTTVVLTPVVRGRAVDAVYAPGTVTSSTETIVSSTAAGRVTAVPVSLGSVIAKGAVVARIDDAQARLQVEQAESQLTSARAQAGQAAAGVNAANARVRTAVAGANSVASQQRAAEAQVGVAEARVRAARVQVATAADNLARIERLYAEGAVSEQQVVQARAALRTAQAELDGANAALDTAQQNARSAAAATQVAQAQVGEARSGAQQAAAASRQAQAAVGTAESQVSQAKLALSRYTIRSLVAGTVSRVVAGVGDYVQIGAPVVAVVQPNALYVRADVDESDIGPVRTGQIAYFTSDAAPNTTYQGTITQVGASASPQTSTYPVDIRYLNTITGLRVNMSVDVNIVVRENPNALLVPSSAVVTTPSPHVWTVVDRRLRARAVTIGTRDTVNGRTEITSGLQEGDLVVANPSPDFREGQRVRVEG